MTLIDHLLEKIAQLQLTHSSLYPAGMFASQRFHRWVPYLREDSNIYFQALIAYTLQDCLPTFNTVQQQKATQIIQQITQNYALYIGTQSPHLYNFYQTQPRAHFPNGYFLSKFKHFIPPDDADDTVLIHMTNPKATIQDAVVVQEFLVKYANHSQKKARHALPKYTHLPAYGVWFGSGKMPIELDICVLCNILCFKIQFNLPFNKQDEASVEFIRIAIDSQDIMHKPFSLSSYYPNATVILYHIARLWHKFAQPNSHLPTQHIIALIQTQFKRVKTQFEKMLLNTSLLKMRVLPQNGALSQAQLWQDFNTFPYFIASITYDTPTRWMETIKNHPIMHVYYKNQAYYYALQLEHEVFKSLIS